MSVKLTNTVIMLSFWRLPKKLHWGMMQNSMEDETTAIS